MIRTQDMVMVTTGKNKGKTGKVLRIIFDSGRAIVEKVNLVKKHQKPTQKAPQGGIIEKEASLALSNLLLYCAKCRRGVRHGVKNEKDGSKKRVCRKCGEVFG